MIIVRSTCSEIILCLNYILHLNDDSKYFKKIFTQKEFH